MVVQRQKWSKYSVAVVLGALLTDGLAVVALGYAGPLAVGPAILAACLGLAVMGFVYARPRLAFAFSVLHFPLWFAVALSGLAPTVKAGMLIGWTAGLCTAAALLLARKWNREERSAPPDDGGQRTDRL